MSQGNYSRFRHLAVERAKPAPTDAQVAAVEKLLGAPLPTSFREFLRVANGGYLEYVIDVPFGEGKSEALSFCSIFSAQDGDFCDETFVGEIRSGRQYQNLPAGVLPFARDGGGSIAYLDLSSDGEGRVIAFVEGLPEWTGLRTESGFIVLASSFDGYVEKLRIDRLAVLDHLTHDAQNTSHIEATEEWLDIGMPRWRDDPELVKAANEARRRVTGGSIPNA
jgi:hypothetical protein